jgi:hypothetical protein
VDWNPPTPQGEPTDTLVIPQQEDDLTPEQKGRICFLDSRKPRGSLFPKPTVYQYYEEQLGKQVQVPCEFINHRWYQIYWTHNEYCSHKEMKFSKYDYELNQIDLPESMRGSLEPSEGSVEPEEQPTIYEEVEAETSISNQSRGSPPTQMDVEPVERAPTTPIDD